MLVSIIPVLTYLECYWRMKEEVGLKGEYARLRLLHNCVHCSSHWEARVISYEVMIAASSESEAE